MSRSAPRGQEVQRFGFAEQLMEQPGKNTILFNVFSASICVMYDVFEKENLMMQDPAVSILGR